MLGRIADDNNPWRKLNLTLTIPLAPAEPAMVIGYIDLHWFLLIILEFPLLHQKPISHWLYALADWLQTPSSWRVRSWTNSWFSFSFSSYMKRLANFITDSILGSNWLPSLSAQTLGHEFRYWECAIYFFQNYPADGEVIRKNISYAYRLFLVCSTLSAHLI